jgi:hypothetical protein
MKEKYGGWRSTRPQLLPRKRERIEKSLATLPLSDYLSVWSRNEREVLRMTEETVTAAPQEERKDRKSHATLLLSDYLSIWSRNEGEVLRMAEQTATAAPQSLTYSPFIGLPEHLEQK